MKSKNEQLDDIELYLRTGGHHTTAIFMLIRFIRGMLKES